MSNNENGCFQTLKLDPMDMHGPVEVTVRVYLALPDGQIGSVAFSYPGGVLPTRDEQLAMIDAVLDPDKRKSAALPAGAAPMDKPGFVAYYTRRETGQAIPLPGDQAFVRPACEIPHAMLVHAIMGTDLTADVAQEYADRKLLTLDPPVEGQPPSFTWNRDLLDAMPDAMLLAIYQRVGAA